MRKAKLDYYKTLLNKFKNNFSKLWAHMKLILFTNEKSNIPLSPITLNDFFVSVFQQALVPIINFKTTVPNQLFNKQTLFLHPMTNTEIIICFNELSNSSALSYDGMNPIVIKKNAVHLANQLCYIFNLSFEKGLYPSRLKNEIVAPIFKSGSRNDPENYKPISILSIFAKLLEKLFF